MDLGHTSEIKKSLHLPQKPPLAQLKKITQTNIIMYLQLELNFTVLLPWVPQKHAVLG